jgi:hypothetical protein
MKTLQILMAGLGMLATSAIQAQDCPNYADERLISLMESIVRVAERVNRATGGNVEELALQTSTLNELLGRNDQEVMDVACRMLQQYPSLESALAEAAAWTARDDIQAWLQQTDGRVGRRDFNCLSDRQYEATRAVYAVLQSTASILQAVCDGFSCYDAACKPPCIALAVFGITLPPFEAGFAVDGLYCSTQHANDMSDLCDYPLGLCPFGRGGSETLVDLETLIDNAIIPEMEGINEGVATVDTLVNTQTLLADRIDRTRDQLTSLESLVDADASRRTTFQADLRAVDIEAALSADLSATPIDLQIPASAGGRIETVREVVADAIASSVNAGLDVGEALVHLRRGDDELNAGNYRRAFRNYRTSYLEIVE